MASNSGLDQPALSKIERQALDRFTALIQPVLDATFTEAHGKPVAEVKRVLARRWLATADKPCPEPMLTNFATQISDGVRVSLRTAAG